MNEKKVQHNEATREDQKKQKGKEKRTIRIRIIPIWARIILFVLLISGSLAAGLMVGYGFIGDGKPKDVFQKSTWTHIGDIVTGESKD
ncbi:DNA-directed RNA polymerase subunit beta [Bacillus spongiae]|uniref:DNA-directed RNA polymerase subunit beta n=1 Tax=Bacillus spongiae TaxID=2683610 RepID=A0ABU8HJ21_9BACI